jgi:hypothetical protein
MPTFLDTSGLSSVAIAITVTPASPVAVRAVLRVDMRPAVGQHGWCVCAGLLLVDLERGCLAWL